MRVCDCVWTPPKAACAPIFQMTLFTDTTQPPRIPRQNLISRERNLQGANLCSLNLTDLLQPGKWNKTVCVERLNWDKDASSILGQELKLKQKKFMLDYVSLLGYFFARFGSKSV